MAKVRASVWPDASTALLFRAPTIRSLAREIEAAKGSRADVTDASIPHAPFSKEQRASGVEVWPMQADLLQQDPDEPPESQVIVKS